MTDDELISRLRDFNSDSPYEEELTAEAATRLESLLAERDALREALEALVRAVNTNELAAAMACHSITSFANVEDALKLALPALNRKG